MLALYKREPVLCNVAIAVAVMLTNHFAGPYSVELKAIIDIIVTALTAASRQLVTPFYAETKVGKPSERSAPIPAEHSATAKQR
jgi:hypothetical protein